MPSKGLHRLGGRSAEGYALVDAPEELRTDHEIMLAAVQRALRYASEVLRAYHKVLLAAVQKEGRAAVQRQACVLGPTAVELRALSLTQTHSDIQRAVEICLFGGISTTCVQVDCRCFLEVKPPSPPFGDG